MKVPKALKRDLLIHISTLVSGGITLLEAVSSFEGGKNNPVFQDMLEKFKTELASGKSFSSCLIGYSENFTNFETGMIRVGEETGRLAEILETITEYQEELDDTVSMVIGSLIYPTILISLAFFVIAFLITFVLPKYKTVFQRSKIELPGISSIMLYIGDFIWEYGLAVLLAVTIISGVILEYFSTEEGKYNLDRFLDEIPGISVFVRELTLLVYCKSMAVMLKNGLPVLQATDLIIEVLNNRYFRGKIIECREEVARGIDFSQSMASTNYFPTMDIQLFTAGEKTGELGKCLEKLSGFHKKRLINIIKYSTTLIEPLMLIFLGLVVSVIALSVFLPMFDMIRILRK
ncbi:type II secretion system F family protein [Candidatus Riflebacteria bacterium]